MQTEILSELYVSRKRNATLLQTGMQPDKDIPSLGSYRRLAIRQLFLGCIVSRRRRHALVQLWDKWASLGHHVGFHRYTRSQFGTREL